MKLTEKLVKKHPKLSIADARAITNHIHTNSDDSYKYVSFLTASISVSGFLAAILNLLFWYKEVERESLQICWVVGIVFLVISMVFTIIPTVVRNAYARQLAEMVSVCNTYAENNSIKAKYSEESYQDVESHLIADLKNAKSIVDRNGSFEDKLFIEDFVSKALEKYANRFGLPDGVGNGEFAEGRADVICTLLYRDCIKDKFVEMAEVELNAPEYTAEKIICQDKMTSERFYISERMLSLIATLPMESRLEVIDSILEIKRKWNLPDFEMDLLKL